MIPPGSWLGLLGGGHEATYTVTFSYAAVNHAPDVTVTGGDTDSLKIRCDADVSDDELLESLQPLHDAIETAIGTTKRLISIRYRGKAHEAVARWRSSAFSTTST